MSTANFLRLVLLAAIWGSSFLFLRIAAPVLGPALLIEYRVAFAALFLAIVGLLLKKRLDLRANWKHYLVLGMFNSALPFLLFAFAARTLSASVLSVLNATAPMWGALIGAAWSRQSVTGRSAFGLVLGTAGVALLVGFDHVASLPGAGLAVAAALGGALSYSCASAYAKSAKSVEPFANAHGSMWAAALLVFPVLPLFPAPGQHTIGIMAAALTLGVLCSGIAYILYFRLIDDVGPTSALTVTFLNPLFGILWGSLFLGEIVGWHTVASAACQVGFKLPPPAPAPHPPAQFAIALPAAYRSADVLAFHGRDPQGVAEQVSPERIRKGVVLDGVPIVLDLALDLALDPGRALCTVDADAPMTARGQRQVQDALHGILGLRIDPAPFAASCAGDALLGPLVRSRPGLRIAQSASIFEALTWAIIGQQINLPFAIALRRTFILQAGRRHSSGLWCYPQAGDVARLEPEAFTTRKFSRSKADTLLRLARLVDSGELALEQDGGGDIARLSASLLAVKGIGPWTVNYTLLRGVGHPDCSLHGDVAIRAALQRLLGEEAKPGLARTEAMLERYRPHRTMAAAHLWASLGPAASG